MPRPTTAIELKASPLDKTVWQAVIKGLKLPPRQAQVVDLVIRGASDKQIAAVLGLAEPTVREYLGRLFRRFKVDDRTGLAVSVMATAIAVKSSSPGA